MHRIVPYQLLLSIVVGVLAGCASTSVAITGAAPATTLCQTGAERLNALFLWGPLWRTDQKDVSAREAAAQKGIDQFLSSSGCYASYEVRRVPVDKPLATGDIEAFVAASKLKIDRVVVVRVRELGPILKLFASPALVDGGTEVVLDLTTLDPANPGSRRDFTVHWQNGGPAVIKGVASLSDDMQAILAAALKAPTGTQ
jgi:hypothetical protein